MKSGTLPVAQTLTAASALFALPHTTDAGVIYTNLEPDTALAPGLPGYADAYFDVNGGAADFRANMSR